MLPRPAGRSCPAGWGECPSRRGSRCSSRRSSRCGFRSWGRCDAGYRISSHMKRTTSAQPLALKRTPSFSSNSRCCGQPGAVRPALLTTRWQGSSAGAEAMARPTRRAWSGMPISRGDLLVGNDLPGGDLRHDGIYLVVECPACQFVGLQWFSVDSGLRRVPRPSPLAMEGRGCPGAAGPDGGSTHAGMGAPMGTVFTTRFPSGARRSRPRSGGRCSPGCRRP